MSYKRLVYLLTALTTITALSVVPVAATSFAATQHASKVTITYATPAGGGQPEIKLYNTLIKRFEKQNPNIIVKQQVIPVPGDPQFWQKLQIEAAANQYPDLTYVHYSWFPQAVRFNYLSRL